ncbi:hypothetical protein DFO73_12056 [Cytobacillus oceanisediminis]|jgi:hypothetical protein|uniref:Uncharacterized protein n=1 Tax=Cytobacillus oceanisediminis TaxID=665099 RepID=A0A2V2ZKM2_9BACI|nr:hypothetical protein DFO73_12056 [Cytobacillus oceanisediminis]
MPLRINTKSHKQYNADAFTEVDYIDLIKIYNSLKDGMSKPEDWFDKEKKKTAKSNLSGLLKKRKKLIKKNLKSRIKRVI